MPKLTWKDWTLVAVWLFYLTLAGPFLISMRDWFGLGLGILIPIVLATISLRRIRNYE